MEMEHLKASRPVLHILVIGFHHQHGAQVEYVYPDFEECNHSKRIPVHWEPLLHVALPDGAHNYEEDYTFFQLPHLTAKNAINPGHVFGIACFQQISSNELKVKNEDVTRTAVQKSVVILLRLPLFGFILSKLSLITRAYFNEKDFSRTDILKDTYTALNQSLSTVKIVDSMYIVGFSVGDLVLKWKQKLLVLFKLFLLEKKVVFWGTPVGPVCATIMSLVSLIPGCIQSLTNSESCLEIDCKAKDEISKKDQYGLPFELFGKDYFLQPYMSMQQIGSFIAEKFNGFVIGSSNVLFKHRSHLMWDALVDLENNDLIIHDGTLSQQLALTTEDLRFGDFILSTVADYQKESGITWDGSDDWVRLQFKYYFLCLLASSAPEKGTSSHIDKQFNDGFMASWRITTCYKRWCQTKHHGIESIHQGHPFEGGLSLSDVKLRIQSRIDALSISEESREKIGAAVKKTGEIVGGAFTSAKSLITSWKGWFTGIVQEINDEMRGNAVNVEFVNSNETEQDGNSAELDHGMLIRERKGLNESPR